MTRFLFHCLTLVILGLGIAACSAPAIIEQTLVSSVLSDPKTLNTYLSEESSSREALGYLFSGMTTLDEQTLQPKPELAESWEISEDGLRYVFTLRAGLKWSDGEPLTAADVDFTFNQIIFNEKISTSQRDVLRIGEAGSLPKVKLLDAQRIEFSLPEPFAPFLIQAGIAIMPKHILAPTIQKLDDKGNPLFLKTWGIDTPVEQVITNGPYILKEYSPNQRLVYAANPYYWKKGSQGETLPKIPRIVLRIVDSEDTSLLRFRSGESDTYTVRGSDFQLLKKEEKRDQFTIYNLGPTLNNNFITFNQSVAQDPKTQKPFLDPVKSSWFRDIHFRQAIAHAIDRQGLVNSVLQGLGQVQNSPISPGNPFSLSPQDGLPTYDYNPQKAKEILIAAGYRYAGSQLTDPQDHPVRFILNTNAGNNQREATGSLIKSDLERIGITVDFQPIAFNTLVQKFDTRSWEAILLGFGGGGVEPNNGANIWRSSGRLHAWNLGNQPGNEASNVEVAEWEKEIDQIFIQGTRELDVAKRKKLYDRFQVIVQEQLPLIGTFNPLVLSALRNRIQGADPRPILGELWNLDSLSLQD